MKYLTYDEQKQQNRNDELEVIGDLQNERDKEERAVTIEINRSRTC